MCIRDRTTAVERYAKLKDGNVFYLEQGQGHPLVILHPTGQSSWVWHKVLDSLSEHFQCYVLDMPGFARSDLPTSPYSIERFSEAIVEFMDNVGIAKAHLMGQRTGAMVSFNLTASYPERVDKLVLVSCPAWTKEEGQVVYEGFMQTMHKDGVLQVQSFERMAAREPYVDRMWTENEEEVVRVRGGWCASTQRANTSFVMPIQRGLGGSNHPHSSSMESMTCSEKRTASTPLSPAPPSKCFRTVACRTTRRLSPLPRR